MKALLIFMLLAGCSGVSNEVAAEDGAQRPEPANSAADGLEPRPETLQQSLAAPDFSARGNARDVEAAIAREMNHLFREVPASITLAGSEWTRVDRRRLASLLEGGRIHDPACDDESGVVCDEVFLNDGKYLRSLPAGKWEVGKYAIDDHHYCARVRGKPEQCFGILRNADWIGLRLELNVRDPNPRWAQILPASRGGMVYP